MRRKFTVIVLIVIGVASLAYVPTARYISGQALERANSKVVEMATASSIQENILNADASNDADLFDYQAVESVPAFTFNPKTNAKAIVGMIEIPSVDVSLPILFGTTNENLATSATTMKRGQKMGEGNYTLAGHNSRNPSILFAPIRHMSKGDVIHITDKQHVYTYRMTNREIVEPTRVDVLDETETVPTITLVSCFAQDGSNRIIITGELESVEDYRD